MKTKLATFQNPVQAFRDYYNRLPWYSFLEKHRLKNLINESVVLDEIDTSMHRLNDIHILTLDAYLLSLVKKKRKLLDELADMVNQKNKNFKMVLNTLDPLDTQFTIQARHDNQNQPPATHTYTDESNEGELSTLLNQLGLQELKHANQLVFTLDQINRTLSRGISKQNRDAIRYSEINIVNHGSTNGFINEIMCNDADSIAFERVNLAANEEPFRAGKYHYLYTTDHWTIEESAIIFRVIAHIIREAKIALSYKLNKFIDLQPNAIIITENEQSFVQLNDQKYPVKLVNGVEKIDIPLSIIEAFNAPTEKDHIGLFTSVEEYKLAHLKLLKGLVSKLNFRFKVDERNPFGPRKVEYHSGILKEKANQSGFSWIDITDSVARNGNAPTNSFIENNVDATKLAKITPIREEVFAIQNTLESPGYGRDDYGQAFPLINGSALKDYIKYGLRRRVNGKNVELDIYLNQIDFNHIANFDHFVAQQIQVAIDSKPGFWNFLSANSAANIRKYEVLTAIADELKAVQDYRACLNKKLNPQDDDDLNLNEGFRNDLNAAEQLFTVKHPYNRFTLVDNKQLLGLAYESQRQIERYDAFKTELESYKPTNWFTRWWRSNALTLVYEKEQALDKAKAELAKYRQGLAEEMFVRINKFVLTEEMNVKANDQYDLLGEYKAFIEMYGTVDTKSKLAMRINYRAHLTSLLSKGLNEDNRTAITKYIDELIKNTTAGSIEKSSLKVVKKILLGEDFNVAAELDDEKIEYIKKYFDANRNKAEPRLNDAVKQTQAEQLYNACVAFNRHLRQGQHNNRKGGYDNSTLFSYFAKEFGGSNLKRIFIHAETQKQLISSDKEKAKVVTYTQLIDKFCDDSNHASEVLKGYRALASENLKFFDSLLIQGKNPVTSLKITAADKFDQGEMRVKYIPIAVLPHQTRPHVVYGYDIQLTDKKTLFLGEHPLFAITRSNFNDYIDNLFALGIYKGDHFALNNVIAVIANPAEKGNYIEKRLAAIFSNPKMVTMQNNQCVFNFSIKDLKHEKEFIRQFRSEVQEHVDDAIKYLYYKYGWNLTTQTILDQLASTVLQEEVRLDRLEVLLARAALYGNDFFDATEQDFLKHLLDCGINSSNFATGERVNRFNCMIEKFLEQKYKPNALLEEIIFKYTNSIDYRDNFVIKEVQFNITQNDEARIHLFHYKWSKRLNDKNNMYTVHLPQAYVSNIWQEHTVIDSKSEYFVGYPIVSRKNQQRFDDTILNEFFVNGDPTTLNRAYKNKYNPNYQLLVDFASRAVQRELNLQLISEHLADPHNEQQHWRYLPIAPIDDVAACETDKLSAEQRERYNMLLSVQSHAKTLYEIIRTYKKERGFGEESISKTDITSKHKEEYNFYQGFTRHFDETKAALTALYGQPTAQRMFEMYGFEDIEKLLNCVGDRRLLQLAKLVDQALTRVEISLNQAPLITHAEQVIWIATFIITDAFMKKINEQLVAIEQSNQRNTVTKETQFDEQLHQRLKELQTRLNILKPTIEATHHAEIVKKQAIQLINHDQISRFFDEVILRIIGEIRDRVGLLSVTTNEKLYAEYIAEINSKQKLLKELFSLLVDYAKSFRQNHNFKELFVELKNEFQIASTRKPVILNSDKVTVKAEMQKVDELWQSVEQQIFSNELSLENTAEKIRLFTTDISLLMRNSEKHIYNDDFHISLIKSLSRDNLILIRLLSIQESNDLQHLTETFIGKIKNAPELKILLNAFLNILKGSQEQRDIDAIIQFKLLNEVMKFAFEGKAKNIVLFSADNLTTLRDGPYGLGKLNCWGLIVKTIIDRYLADPTANLSMLAICDYFADGEHQASVLRKTNAIRKARSFIDKTLNRKGFELKADFENGLSIAEIRTDSQLEKVLTDTCLHFQKEIAEIIKRYDPKFINAVVCKNTLESYLNVNVAANQCDDNNERLNKHIEFLSNLYLYIQLNPNGDYKSVDMGFKKFIDQFVAAVNRRPAQIIPCGMTFARDIIHQIASNKEVQCVEDECHKYIKTILDSEIAAKTLAQKIKSEFNSIDYFRYRGITALAKQKLTEHLLILLNKLSLIDDNIAARKMFITEFNQTQPFRIKINPEIINAHQSSLNDEIKNTVEALILGEINSIRVINNSPAPAAPSEINRHLPVMIANHVK